MIRLSNPGTEYFDSGSISWPHTVSPKALDVVHNMGIR